VTDLMAERRRRGSRETQCRLVPAMAIDEAKLIRETVTAAADANR
jgi:hypothetical protein